MWLCNSSIGRKVVMSVTGVALILFLTFHMSMNIAALFSGDAYNMICEFLGANWYALVATLGLAALAVIHILYAFWLTMQNRKARGTERYAVTTRPAGVEWSSQNMLVLGIIIILGLLLHRVDRYRCGTRPGRRLCLHRGHILLSGICSPLHRMARGSLVPPHSWFLERNADIRLEW